MGLSLITPPAVEPVTVTEVKEHLRLESSSLEEGLQPELSIAPGIYPITAAYGIEGTGVDVLSGSALVLLEAGSCGPGGSIDVKLQDSDDGVIYTDVTGGAFIQVDELTDETVYTKAYRAGRRYLRAVSTVAGAACEFAVTIVIDTPEHTEDPLLEGLIRAAREYAEGYQNRSFITQVWDLSFDTYPRSPIKFALSPVQSVESITCYEEDDTPHVVDPGNYQVDTGGFTGRIALKNGISWPSITLRPLNGVVIRFTVGYGDTGEDVPEKTRIAIKLMVGHLYENREATDSRAHYTMPFAVDSLLGLERVVPV